MAARVREKQSGKPFHPLVEGRPQLPEDVGFNYSKEALDWLAQYEVPHQMLVDNEVMWSESKKWLIFPIHSQSSDGKEDLVFYTARNFNPDRENQKEPKWISYGSLGDHIPIIGRGNTDKTIVIVEDIISALRVGEHAACVPLFGTYFQPLMIQRLARYYEDFILWLDYDAFQKALNNSKNIQVYAPNCEAYIIRTEYDPKLHSSEEIITILGDVILGFLEEPKDIQIIDNMEEAECLLGSCC